MKINFKNSELNDILRFQEGGEMPQQEAPMPEEAAPAPEQGGDPMEQILQAAAQAVQNQDANLALQVCQTLVQMAGGGGAPVEAPQEQPVYRKGGRLVRWISK